MTSIGGPGQVGASPGAVAGAARSVSAQSRGLQDFDGVLRETLARSSNVRFSRHARERIERRGIPLSPGEIERLGRAMDQAEVRGAKDSLVLSGRSAYVVNIPSRTVVTALYGEQAKGNVFTKIDSAVVI